MSHVPGVSEDGECQTHRDGRSDVLHLALDDVAPLIGVLAHVPRLARHPERLVQLAPSVRKERERRVVPLSIRTDQRRRARVDQDDVERDDPARRGGTAAEVGKHVARDADEVETGAIQRFDILLT